MCVGYIRHVCTAQWSSLQQTAVFIRAVYVRLVFTATVHGQTMLKSWLEHWGKPILLSLHTLYSL